MKGKGQLHRCVCATHAHDRVESPAPELACLQPAREPYHPVQCSHLAPALH